MYNDGTCMNIRQILEQETCVVRNGILIRKEIDVWHVLLSEKC